MKLKSPHFDKLKSLTKKQKKLILAGIALFLLILAASYTVFIAPLLQKEQWIYKEETVERGTLNCKPYRPCLNYLPLSSLQNRRILQMRVT